MTKSSRMKLAGLISMNARKQNFYTDVMSGKNNSKTQEAKNGKIILKWILAKQLVNYLRNCTITTDYEKQSDKLPMGGNFLIRSTAKKY
jgi:hypothetical protein